MSKAKPKKQKKKARKGNGSSEAVVEELPPTDRWFHKDSPVKEQGFSALKLELLGPFLFGQPTLSSHTISSCKEVAFFEGDVAPAFYTREQYDTVKTIVNTVLALISILDVEDGKLAEACLHPTTPSHSHLKSNAPWVQMLLQHKLLMHPAADKTFVYTFFSAIRPHLVEFFSKAQSNFPEPVSSQTLQDKEKLIAPVKERGNTNFKQERFKAAIGDYTTAIKLCPFGSVLYCNRALCYHKNEEYWCACVDSYKAIVLRPGWEKAYYRCAEAWAKLGEPHRALAINKQGLKECTELGDLSKQSTELKTESGLVADPDELGTPVELGEPEEPVKPAHPPEQSTVAKPTKNLPKLIESTTHDASKNVIVTKLTNPAGEIQVAVLQRTDPNKAEKVSRMPQQSLEDALREPSKPPKKAITQPGASLFEKLDCPELEPRLSASFLKGLSKRVNNRFFKPEAYFNNDWRILDTPAKEFKPKTDPLTINDEMDAKFEEIWCPLLADEADKLNIKPQRTF